MNPKDVNNRARLIMHRLIARRLGVDPRAIDEARADLDGISVIRRVADLADMPYAGQARSGGRALLAGCERYRRVVLDFEGVRSAAPSFADEIFRVWQTAHPSVDIEVVNVAAELVPWLRRGGWQPPAAG